MVKGNSFTWVQSYFCFFNKLNKIVLVLNNCFFCFVVSVYYN